MCCPAIRDDFLFSSVHLLPPAPHNLDCISTSAFSYDIIFQSFYYRCPLHTILPFLKDTSLRLLFFPHICLPAQAVSPLGMETSSAAPSSTDHSVGYSGGTQPMLA